MFFPRTTLFMMLITIFTPLLFCFSEELPNVSQHGCDTIIASEEFQTEPSDHSAAVMHIAFGDVKLLSHMYGEALEEFERSLSMLGKHPENELYLEFFARFGMIVAYDNLGLHEECEQTLGSLFLLLYENGDEEDEEEKSLLDELPRGSKTKQHFDFMRKIAGLASSTRVVNLLEGIIDDMEEELSFELTIAPSLTNDRDWYFATNQSHGPIQISPCSFKNNWRNLCKVFNKAESKLDTFFKKIDNILSFFES